ncbi:hypothetical protein HHI36_020104 [Cryptolaemus montrouzieri]|uniref:Uncharacterized protein n=1 Tax=Cryptolaemus montrouzieri TaxID=559131 RepID=A0ABD2NA08_9CUCU
MINVPHKLNEELEFRIEDQKQIINLLKTKDKVSEINPNNNKYSSSSDYVDGQSGWRFRSRGKQGARPDKGGIDGTNAKEEKTINHDRIIDHGQKNFTNVMPVPRSRTVGKSVASEQDDVDDFKGAKKLSWLYVSRARPDSTSERLENYLKKLFPDETFIVQELELNTNTNKSYKVDFNFSLLEDIKTSQI